MSKGTVPIVVVMLLFGGIIIWAVSRPSTVTSVRPNTSSGMSGLNAFGSFVGGLLSSKPGAPSAVRDVGTNEGTYQTGFTPDQSGNTLVNPDTGKTLVYGTD